MKITLEKVDEVIDRTGCSYNEAKAALEKTEGDVLAAVLMLEESYASQAEGSIDKDAIVGKIKAAIKKGNVNRLYITRNGETLVSVPVTVGVVGGIIGMLAAPWAVIVGALVAYGSDCRVVIEHNDGSSEEI